MTFSKSGFYLLIATLLGLAFIILSLLTTKGLFLSVDNYINQTLVLTVNNPLYFISRLMAYLYLPFTAFIILLCRHFILKKQKREAFFLLASFSGFIVAELILKLLFRISCPQSYFGYKIADQEVFGLTNTIQSLGLMKFCYPSSHVASYVVFAGYLAYLTKKFTKEKSKRILYLGILLSIIMLVGPSRLYLHVHWFSDVVGGYLLGFLLLSLIISLRLRRM